MSIRTYVAVLVGVMQLAGVSFAQGNAVIPGTGMTQPLQDQSYAAARSQYAALHKALVDLQHTAAEGGWPVVNTTRSLQLGDTGEDVAELAARLGQATVPTAPTTEAMFDQQLHDAVTDYQRQHGLEADGIAGRRTIAHMNVSVEQRIAQVLNNIQRWDQLDFSGVPHYLIINIPEFQLRIMQDNTELTSMRVVVGKRTSPTPEMKEHLEYMVFNPYWNVPTSITHREIVPKVIDDPEYLKRRNFEVLSGSTTIDPFSVDWPNVDLRSADLRIRQRPGPDNALGSVKFIFPNPRAVYLHDTPAKADFDRTVRTFSHGCIRVEDPALLAHKILQLQNGWSNDAVHRLIASKQTKYVKLDAHLPVYITYHTVVVADGRVRFLPDVYDIDATAQAASPRQLLADADLPAVTADAR